MLNILPAHSETPSTFDLKLYHVRANLTQVELQITPALSLIQDIQVL